MIINRNFCSIFQMIFDVSCLYRTIFLSQDPTCIANGASYRFATRGDSCTASYYNCDSNNYAVLQSCPISQTGSYFNHITRQCNSGTALSSCSSVQAGNMIYKFELITRNSFFYESAMLKSECMFCMISKTWTR